MHRTRKMYLSMRYRCCLAGGLAGSCVLAGPSLKALLSWETELCCEKGPAWGQMVWIWLLAWVLLCVNPVLPILSELDFAH